MKTGPGRVANRSWKVIKPKIDPIGISNSAFYNDFVQLMDDLSEIGSYQKKWQLMGLAC